jgi:hypothetical protein
MDEEDTTRSTLDETLTRALFAVAGERYDLTEPTPDIRVLLDEVDRDPTCIFWG